MKKVYVLVCLLLLCICSGLWALGNPEKPGPVEDLRVYAGYKDGNIWWVSNSNARSVHVNWKQPLSGMGDFSGYGFDFLTLSPEGVLNRVTGVSSGTTYLSQPIYRNTAQGYYWDVAVNSSPAAYNGATIVGLYVYAIAVENVTIQEGTKSWIRWEVDNTLPQISGATAASDLSGESNCSASYTTADNRQWFHGDVAITFAASDTQSGLNDSSWVYSIGNTRLTGNTDILSVNTLGAFPDVSGSQIIRASVADNVLQRPSPYQYTLNVDNSAPDPVDPASIQVRLTETTPQSHTLKGWLLSWASALDHPDSKLPVYYYYSLLPEPATTALEATSTPLNSPGLSLTELTRGQVQWLDVQTVDYFGQRATWSRFQYPLYLPAHPAGISAQQGVSVQKVPGTSLADAQYKVMVVLDKQPGFLHLGGDTQRPFVLAGIRILYTPAGATAGLDVTGADFAATVIAGDDGHSGQIMRPAPETGWHLAGGYLAYTFLLDASAYKHATGEITVYTCYPAYLGAVQERQEAAPVSVSMPNFPAALSLEIFELPAGRTLARSSVTPDLQIWGHAALEENLASLTLPVGSLNLGLRIADIDDLEGDRLIYKIAEDINGTFTNGEIDLTTALPINGSGVYTFHLFYGEENSDPEFNQTFTNSIQISLDINSSRAALMPDFRVTDSGGTALPRHNGVIYTREDSLYLQDLFLQNAEGLQVSVDGVIFSYPAGGEPLTPGEVVVPLPQIQGELTVILQAQNQYNNPSPPVSLIINRDTQAPQLQAEDFSYNQLPEVNALEIILPADFGDIRDYMFDFNGIYPAETLQAGAGRLELNLAGLEPNTLIPCQITAADYAGGVGTPLVFELYTPPQAGHLADLPQQDGTSLSWTVSTPGNCAAYRMQELNPDGSYGPLTFDTPASATILHTSGLAPQGQYTFCLLALNPHGYPVAELDAEGQIKRYTYTLGNNLPAWGPAPLNPQPALFSHNGTDYLKGSVSLNWDSALDADSTDTLYYLVEYRLQGAGEWSPVAPGTWQTATNLVFPSGLLNEGAAYEVHVLVRDQHMAPAHNFASPLLSFTADSTPPLLSVERGPGLTPLLHVESSDSLSGLAGLGAELVAGGQVLLSLPPLPLVYDPESDTYTTSLDTTTRSLAESWPQGNCSLRLTATDNTGNTTLLEEYNLLFDHIPPHLEAGSLTLGQTSSTGYVPLSLRVADEVSGVKALYYGFVSDPASEPELPSTAGKIPAPVSLNLAGSGSELVLTERQLPLPRGGSGLYYLVAAWEDWAGNISEPQLYTGHGVLLDTTPPRGTLEVTGLILQGQQHYWNRNIPLTPGSPEVRTLAAVCTVWDDETASQVTGYAICQTDAMLTRETSVWYATLADAAAVTDFSQGVDYRAAALLVNEAGAERVIYSSPFTYDEARVGLGTGTTTTLITPRGEQPLEAAPPDSQTGSLTLYTGETVSLKTYALYTNFTPYGEYSLQIRRYPVASQPGFMELVAGSRDGRLTNRELNRIIPQEEELAVYGSDTEFSFTIPAVESGVYEFLLETRTCLSAPGLEPQDTSRFLINIQPPAGTLLAADNGPYVGVAEGELPRLTATWSCAGGNLYGVRSRLRADGLENPLTDWSPVTTGSSVSADVIDWQPCIRYYFELAPVASGGEEADFEHSIRSVPGVQFDATIPHLFALDYPAATTSQDLWISWSAEDPESELAKVELKLFRVKAATDPESGLPLPVWEELRSDWLDLTPRTRAGSGLHNLELQDSYGHPLPLVSGDRLGFILRITNRADLQHEEKSTLIILDDTPPPAPLVLDQGETLNPADYPAFSWAFDTGDAESGTKDYLWTLVSDPAGLAEAVWQSTGGERSLDLSMTTPPADFTRTHGSSWYLAVKVVNGAGNQSAPGLSDGLVYDETAPLFTRLQLLTQNGAGGHQNYLTATDNLTAVLEAREDLGSLSEYSAALGLQEAGGWTPLGAAVLQNLAAEAARQLSDPQYIYTPGHLPLPPLAENTLTPGEDILVVRGESRNDSGQSSVGYSPGSMLATNGPQLTFLLAYTSGTLVHTAWNLTPAHAPLAQTEVLPVAYTPGAPFPGSGEAWQSVEGSNYSFDSSSWSPGPWIVYLKSTDQAGFTVTGSSNIVLLDVSPPEITSFTYSPAAAPVLRFSASVTEEGSSIEEYAYALGSAASPLLYTAGWVSLFTNATQLLDLPVDLSLLPGNVPLQTEVFLQLKVKSSAGLWSNTLVSDPIPYDQQQPDTPQVQLADYNTSGQYTIYSSQISGVQLSSRGLFTPVVGYRLGIIPAAEQPAYAASGLSGQPEHSLSPVNHLQLTNITAYPVPGVVLEEGSNYVVAVQTVNSAGLWSEPGFSPPVQVDLSDPVIELSAGAQIIINTFTQQGDTALVTNPLYIPFTVSETPSDRVQVQFYLERPGQRIDLALQTILAVNFGQPLLYTLDLSSQPLAFGPYQLAAEIRDAAGRSAACSTSRSLLLNTPPEVKLNNIVVNPAEWVNFMDELQIVDPESGEYNPAERSRQYLFKYEWDLDDDGTTNVLFDPLRETDPHTAADWQDPLQYYDTIYRPGHPLNLRMTDPHGGSVSVRALVYVLPTSSGSLNISETWDADHGIVGDIIVPAGITLTIASDVTALVCGDYRITVYGTLVMLPGSRFKHVNTVGQYSNDWWQGVRIEPGGSVSLTGATLQQAHKALTLNAVPATAITVSGTTFDYNGIGIHAVSSSPQITDCSFSRQTRYGVKEDAGAAPELSGCSFSGNTYDYYDEEQTVISAFEAQ